MIQTEAWLQLKGHNKVYTSLIGHNNEKNNKTHSGWKIKIQSSLDFGMW